MSSELCDATWVEFRWMKTQLHCRCWDRSSHEDAVTVAGGKGEVVGSSGVASVVSLVMSVSLLVFGAPWELLVRLWARYHAFVVSSVMLVVSSVVSADCGPSLVFVVSRGALDVSWSVFVVSRGALDVSR